MAQIVSEPSTSLEDVSFFSSVAFDEKNVKCPSPQFILWKKGLRAENTDSERFDSPAATLIIHDVLC